MVNLVIEIPMGSWHSQDSTVLSECWGDTVVRSKGGPFENPVHRTDGSLQRDAHEMMHTVSQATGTPPSSALGTPTDPKRRACDQEGVHRKRAPVKKMEKSHIPGPRPGSQERGSVHTVTAQDVTVSIFIRVSSSPVKTQNL